MPGLLNDTNLNVDKNGMITTGLGGFADGAGNPTYPYAKNDVSFGVGGWEIISDGAAILLTYLTGDIPTRVCPASRTAKVTIPFPQQIFRSTSIGGVPTGANPITAGKGVLVKSLALFYRCNTTDITSITMAINYMQMAVAAALPTVVVPTATLAGGTLTAAANVYGLVCTITAPAWISLADAALWGVASIVVPGSSTVDLIGASWRCAYAIN